MRANTAALRASPFWSIITSPSGLKGSRLDFPSVSALFDTVAKHARTGNERNWISSPAWLGLVNQTIPDFESSRVDKHALSLTQKALASLSHAPRQLGRIAPSITGAAWSTPAVLAGLPLAALARKRTALPPVELNLVLDFSSRVTPEAIAPFSARVAKAIHTYRQNGGVVNLFIHSLNHPNNSNSRLNFHSSRVKVNTADISTLATALSPAFARAYVYPLNSAESEKTRDTLPIYRKKPFPDVIYLTSCSDTEIAEAIAQAEARLALV